MESFSVFKISRRNFFNSSLNWVFSSTFRESSVSGLKILGGTRNMFGSNFLQKLIFRLMHFKLFSSRKTEFFAS